MSRALDYATRTLIAETVAHEIRAASMLLQPSIEKLEPACGPYSQLAESLVIGASLLYGPSSIATPAKLEPSDFWSHLHQRYWTALASDSAPRDIPGLVAWLSDSGLISGPLEPYQTDLERLREAATLLSGHRDVDSAVELIREHARCRRLVDSLRRIACDVQTDRMSHKDAYLELREYFSKNNPKSA